MRSGAVPRRRSDGQTAPASAARPGWVWREAPCVATASSGSRPRPSLRLLRPARPPAQSAALGPGEPGRLSGRRRLSATLTSRGARRPGTSVTPGSPLCPVPPPPPYCHGDARAAAILLLFLPKWKERRKPSGGFGRASGGPCPRGSVLEEAEAEGSARHSRAERVSPPGSGCSWQLRESSGGGGSRSFPAMGRRSGAGDARSSALSLWTAV